jgi:hypothetical protein
MVAGEAMRRIGGEGFMVFMIVIYGALALFAVWRRLRRPEHRRGKGSEVLTVSPVTTPSGAAVRSE